MAYTSKEKLFSKKWFYSYSLILIGSFIMAAGFVFFVSPHKLVPGGVYGIGIVLYHMTNGLIPVGLTGLAFNIPLTIIGIRLLGPRFGVKTIVGFVMASFFIDGLTWWWGDRALVENDILLSSIFGGILLGFGLGLIFKAKASSGGSSIMAMIATKITRVPVGQTLVVIDSIIVIFGLIAFKRWDIPLYSWIVIYVTGKVIDVTMEGISYEKTLFIISDKWQDISNKILHDLKRGGTIFEGRGMYNNAEKKILFVNVTRRELSILTEYVHELDPKAFLTVIEASEILGEGFKALDEKVGDDH
jgi:uncharacterized membrane-anchored protein YitT (DUF2179 family)